MPRVRYGGKQGRPVQLDVDPDLVAVRTRSKRSFRGGPVSRPEAAVLEDMQLIAEFPEAGVEVFRKRAGARVAVRAVKEALRRIPDTRFAGSVLVNSESREPVVYTENVFIKFRDEEEHEHCLQVIKEAGLNIKRELTYATNAFFVEAPEGTGQEVFAICDRLLEREDVDLCHPEIVEPAARRRIFDPQWHLKTTTVNGQTVSASANVEAAHALSLGEGITIAVIDDGFDMGHEEFSSAGKIVAPRDFRGGDDDPSPGPGDDHGTACAGVACADGRFGASGVAPRARLMPLRMPLSLNSQRLADAFVWAADNGADVISNSWGPEDGVWYRPSDPKHKRFSPLPDNIRLAIDYAADKGRSGKGCLIFFASGNGNESVDLDGYASYDKVLAVAACNDRSRRSVYSDFGKAVFCSFPSNDFGFPPEGRPDPLTPGIWTVDRTGRAGYNPDPDSGEVTGDPQLKYTNGFGGTSSACPGAAGVAALVLARNPALRRQEVKDILRQSCERIDPQGGAYDRNGHSVRYGHGRLDANAAVKLALPREHEEKFSIEKQFNLPITDFGTTTAVLSVDESAPLQSLSVSLDIEHTFVGDLVIRLLPPPAMNAQPVMLHNRKGGRAANLRQVFDPVVTPALAGLQQKNPKGPWTLEVRDAARLDTGTLRRFGLTLRVAASVPRAASPATSTGKSARGKPSRQANAKAAANVRQPARKNAARKRKARA